MRSTHRLQLSSPFVVLPARRGVVFPRRSGIVGRMDTITAQEFHASPGVADWRTDGAGAHAMFRTGDFATGARLFAEIAELADAAKHHPDVDVRYATVRVSVFTHSAGGLTEKDAALAARISEAARSLGVPSESDGAQSRG
jgi:4a-hydroxytetrahydrobiopterin dehydratase